MYTRLDGARSRVPVDESKIGVIAAKCRPHLTNAVVGDPGVVDQEWARREGLVAFAGYPLLAGGRLWGVMAMFARHRLSDFALEELGVVAEKIATGISRTRLEEALKRYAETQEVLLREVNHRVKNNLAVIISMLHKEEDRAKLIGLTGSLPALSDLHDRIEGLLIVHGMLSSAKWQDLKISELCSALVTRIARSLAGKMTVTIGETAVTVNSGQAHYLALVLNELVTNTLKYAAPFSGRPEIVIAISRDGDKIGMEYRDNGPGYPEAVVNGDYSGTSIGFDLMNGIVRQSLRGRISYRNENGAVAEIVFPG
ncbi:MAG: sensor histidine kinase [Candidatus Methylomirabilia bacterium]